MSDSGFCAQRSELDALNFIIAATALSGRRPHVTNVLPRICGHAPLFPGTERGTVWHLHKRPISIIPANLPLTWNIPTNLPLLQNAQRKEQGIIGG